MRPWILSLSTEARTLTVCGLILLLVLPAPAAFAATAEDRRAARVHFNEAEKAYANEAYAEALASYEKAYALFEAPAFLFNMAQCQRHLDRPKEALDLYRRFIEASPNATNRTVVEGLIVEMEEAVAALPPEPPVLLPSEDLFEKEEAPVVAAVEPKPVHQQWWFWTAAAVVVGGVATGVAIAAQPGGELPPASLGDISLR